MAVSVTGPLERASDWPLDVQAVYARHADFVWRSLQRMGVADGYLEDAMQDVFLVVHRRLPTYDRSSAVTTWLFGICLRVAAAHRRRAFRRYERPLGEMPEPSGDPNEPSPEDAAASREARVRLRQVLDGLDPAKRAVFVMFEIEQMSCQAIADWMGVPVGTVYSRLSAARTEFEQAAVRWRERDRRTRGGTP